MRENEPRLYPFLEGSLDDADQAPLSVALIPQEHTMSEEQVRCGPGFVQILQKKLVPLF